MLGKRYETVKLVIINPIQQTIGNFQNRHHFHGILVYLLGLVFPFAVR